MINEINHALAILSRSHTIDSAKNVVGSVYQLLDKQIGLKEIKFQQFSDADGKIRANSSWFLEDEVNSDRRATYLVNDGNHLNIDFKLFGVKNSSKTVISWIQALTPNFEDEPFYSKMNLGIDFIVPSNLDRVIIVLSNNYFIRTLELKDKLSNTQIEIFNQWEKIQNFENKKLVHNILWDSFDLQPINKKFYLGISERFNILREHLILSGEFDEKHASQFANRLIGRIVFLWFLSKKNLLNEEFDYLKSEKFSDDNEYYRSVLSPLFYEVLNVPVSERKHKDLLSPYLNGGLFEKHIFDTGIHGGILFPKNYFDNFYQFLHSYNFTTDESSTEYQQVAIDPEMLGRIFENLLAELVEDTGTQARKAKGAFYTPREVVDHMCRDSLRKYLRSHLKEDEYLDRRLWQLVDAPDREFIDQDHNWRRDWKPYKAEILKLLDELKILDPACGSGAFPIGMMQLLLRVYERLEPRLDHQKTKRQIVENNLYGSDIEPMAIEISRIRAWLSLAVDESKADNFVPLPNLEFKFVCANSLVPLSNEVENTLTEDPEIEIKLQSLRREYFSTNSVSKKQQLRNKYKTLTSTQDSLFGESKRSQQIKSYKPFEPDASALFFDPLVMLGESKFDIVIGNPPYGAELSAADKKLFKEIYTTANKSRDGGKGSINSYVLFIERGIELAKLAGNVNYILPISVISSDSSQSLHEYLRNNCAEMRFANFAVRPQPVFANAVVNATIATFDQIGKKCERILVTKLNRKTSRISLQELLANLKFIEIDKSYLVGRIPKVGEEIELQILKKLFQFTNTVRDLSETNGSSVFYRAAGGRYFKIITVKPTGSSAEAAICVSTGLEKAVAAILSSNLFFWYYQLFSDNLNLKKMEVESFPIPTRKQLTDAANKLNELFDKYISHVYSNSVTRDSKNYAHVTSFTEFKIAPSKAFIDSIDDSLASMYGLTDQELEFIKNYEIQIRLGDQD